MEKYLTARQYAQSVLTDPKEAENFERRLQRYAKALPDDQKMVIGRYYALTQGQWEALAEKDRPVGRPRKAKPQETP